ncbi:N-alpha-acetyltransferase 40-like [Tropilaelaps mercedesae]|uniref:N-alpha-acetyltransferase 40 n=1 Tax=Tropilaelaps mercedesae TaxID=418985 RepID=A0A1V9XYV8_9ACAR|nr:N-alpha-acetyltransferase 40-like [Tropilaelaps mercedesae]
MPPRRKGNPRPNVGELQVRLANDNREPLDQLIDPSECDYQRNELNLTISRCWASDATTELREFVFALTEVNMRELYEQSSWGWNESQKRKELTGKTSQYIVVKDKSKGGAIVGFVHFRFEMDFALPVLYCYEIQLTEEVQRRGIGAHLMDILYKLAERFRMKKILLTVFKHNSRALNFYTKKLKFRTDSTDPKENHKDYTILFKKVEKI